MSLWSSRTIVPSETLSSVVSSTMITMACPRTASRIHFRNPVGAGRTFFRYFPTKEAVLFPDADAKSNWIMGALAARPADEHPFASLLAVVGELADEVEAAGDEIDLRQRLAADCPGLRTYERTVLETRVGDTVAAFVAGRLGVADDADPRPRVWAGLAMSSFRVALHLWLDSG